MKVYKVLSPILLLLLVFGFTINSDVKASNVSAERVKSSDALKVNIDKRILASGDEFLKIENNGYKIVEVALKEVGNNGDKINRWYGLSLGSPWCAAFISYCADKCGYIEKDIIPKFASVPYGVDWFQSRDLWLKPGSVPLPGMIIFFDFENYSAGIYWTNDGRGDHVGFVEYVEDGYVHCVEGNNRNLCRQTEYPLDSRWILGYGTPEYPKY